MNASKWRRLGAGSLAVALTAFAVGCGGGGDTSGATSGEDSEDPGVARAEAVVAPYMKTPTEIGPTVPIEKMPTGSLVEFVECGVPICKAIGDGVEEAAQAAGLKFKRVSQGNTPQEIARGWDQVVQDRPAAAISAGVPAALFQPQLDQLAAQGTKVIGWTMPEEAGNGLTINMIGPKENELNGTLLADYVTADTGGKADTLMVNAPLYTVLTSMKEGFEERYRRDCPDCGYGTLDIKPTDIGKSVPERIVSYLQKNPDTNWIVMTFGDPAIGVPEAIKAAGLELPKIITTAGGKVNYAYIEDGEQAADLGSSTDFLGWKAIDAAARAISGQSVEPDEGQMPTQFLTEETIDFNIDEPWPSVPDFRQQFEALWGTEG